MTVRADKTGFVGDRAVVLGGSVAGLLAARVLSEAYEQVTVVERDQLPAGHAPRRGVPQGRHIHALVSRGQRILEELFPGFTDELVAQGVPTMDVSADARWYLNGHRLAQQTSGLVALSASRPRIEGQLRHRVRNLPGVRILDDCDVTGIATTPDRKTVTGVRLFRHADGSAEETLSADLVVDATGRGSRTPGWLVSMGYRPPSEDRTTLGVGYTSCRFRLRPGALGSDHAILTAPPPQNPRGGGLAMIENGECILSLAGILGDFPPTDPAGLLAFARAVHHPDYGEALRDAEALEDPVAFRFPTSMRRRYERLHRFPNGLLVQGDALCSSNPIYGQGMAVAALGALTLQAQLQRGGPPQPARFFQAMARTINPPWAMTEGGDLAFPGVEGARSPQLKLMNAYLARLSAAAADDPDLAVTFLRVAGMVDPPTNLLHPSVATRVLRHGLAPGRQGQPARGVETAN